MPRSQVYALGFDESGSRMAIDARWGAATHQGNVRPSNQDSVLSGPSVFAVADGMGGHAGGERASAIAVAGLSRMSQPVPGVEEVLCALSSTNDEIVAASRADPTVSGMGTTVAGVALSDREAVVFNLGDSRVYRLRNTTFEQLSVDHSLVAELVRDGEITEEQARTDPRRNVVTRALGIGPSVEIHHLVVDVLEGDRFLVCSDGLFNEVGPDIISEALQVGGPLEMLAQRLLRLALDAGGRDNVSVVLLEIDRIRGDVEDLDVDTNPVAVVDTNAAVPTAASASVEGSVGELAAGHDAAEEGA